MNLFLPISIKETWHPEQTTDQQIKITYYECPFIFLASHMLIQQLSIFFPFLDTG